MKIKLNGEEVKLEQNYTIERLLEKYSIDIRKIAVEKNGELVFRRNFSETNISENDNIEIIHFIGGG